MALFAIVTLAALAVARESGSRGVFNKPEFSGKVVDSKTKAPVEGVFVVAVYRKRSGTGETIKFDARETTTDKNGEFIIPPYAAALEPRTTGLETEFYFYKPGYRHLRAWDGYYGAGNTERYFSTAKRGAGRVTSQRERQEEVTVLQAGLVVLTDNNGYDTRDDLEWLFELMERDNVPHDNVKNVAGAARTVVEKIVEKIKEREEREERRKKGSNEYAKNFLLKEIRPAEGKAVIMDTGTGIEHVVAKGQEIAGGWRLDDVTEYDAGIGRWDAEQYRVIHFRLPLGGTRGVTIIPRP